MSDSQQYHPRRSLHHSPNHHSRDRDRDRPRDRDQYRDRNLRDRDRSRDRDRDRNRHHSNNHRDRPYPPPRDANPRSRNGYPPAAANSPNHSSRKRSRHDEDHHRPTYHQRRSQRPPFEPTHDSTLLLTQIPPSCTWQTLKPLIRDTYHVRVQYVRMDEEEGVAQVVLASHREAVEVLKQWEEGRDMGQKGELVWRGFLEDLKETQDNCFRRKEENGIVERNQVEQEQELEQKQEQQRQEQEQQMQQQQAEWETQQQKQQQQQAEWEAQQQAQWEAQQQAHHQRQSERHNLQTQLSNTQTQLSLLEKQSTTVQKQLNLHKQMLSLLKDDAKKSKKLKEILNLTKQVNSIQKERNQALERIQTLQQEEQVMMEKHKQQVAEERSPTRKFRLDNRTTVLQVSGWSKEEEGGLGSKEGQEQVLEKVKRHLSAFGHVADIRWKASQVEQIQKEPDALVNCASRSDAEHIKEEGGTMGDTTLVISWYHDDYERMVPNASKGDTEPSMGGKDAVHESNNALEQTLYYAEDDDLMVDYDEEEEDDDGV